MSETLRVHGGTLIPNDPSTMLFASTDTLIDLLMTCRGRLVDNLSCLSGNLPLQEAIERAAKEHDWPFALPSDVVFPASHFPMNLHLGRRAAPWKIETPGMVSCLSYAASGEWCELPETHPAHRLALKLRSGGVIRPRSSLHRFEAAGIYRLQHAGLLFRSQEGTGILTDPVCENDEHGWLMPQDITNVHAIVISHSHSDHFSLWTIMQFPRETTIVVPQVPRGSMLSSNMEALLRDAGFTNVIAAPWHSTVTVRDVQIHVYPFYGEQPWLTFPAPVADLRNHGSTYLFQLDGKLAWILIDSGQEFEHRMMDVCEAVLNDHERVDVVLSNLRSFPWHPKQVDKSGRYLLCFDRERLARSDTWPLGVPMTLGLRGMWQLLQKLEPRNFLPYAHWWQPKTRASHLMQDNLVESVALSEMRGFGRLGTELREWQVGDRLDWTVPESVTVHEGQGVA